MCFKSSDVFAHVYDLMTRLWCNTKGRLTAVHEGVLFLHPVCGIGQTGSILFVGMSSSTNGVPNPSLSIARFAMVQISCLFAKSIEKASMRGISPCCVHRETSASIVERGCTQGDLWTWWCRVHIGLFVPVANFSDMVALLCRRRFTLCWSCCCKLIPILQVFNRGSVHLHVIGERLVGVPSNDES